MFSNQSGVQVSSAIFLQYKSQNSCMFLLNKFTNFAQKLGSFSNSMGMYKALLFAIK
jgi:hypothetical protein